MKKYFAIAALLVAVLGWALPARAVPLGGKVGFIGNLGYSVYNMDKFNDDIEATNNLGVLSENLDKVNGGLTWSAGLQYGISDFLLVGANFTMLNGRSQGKTALGSDFTVDIPAIEIGPVIRLVLPVAEPINGTLNGEGDWLHAWERAQSPGSDRTFSGNNVSVKVGLGAEVFPLPFMAVGADVGYRFGRVTELRDGDQVLQTLDGTNAELDYSGPFFLGGLRLYL